MEQHYSLPENKMRKTLIELVESKNNLDLLYPPSVMECSVCLENCKNNFSGKCTVCGRENSIRRSLSEPSKEIKFSMDLVWDLTFSVYTNICSWLGDTLAEKNGYLSSLQM